MANSRWLSRTDLVSFRKRLIGLEIRSRFLIGPSSQYFYYFIHSRLVCFLTINRRYLFATCTHNAAIAILISPDRKLRRRRLWFWSRVATRGGVLWWVRVVWIWLRCLDRRRNLLWRRSGLSHVHFTTVLWFYFILILLGLIYGFNFI